MYTQENDRAIGRWSADEELSNTNHRKKERKKRKRRTKCAQGTTTAVDELSICA